MRAIFRKSFAVLAVLSILLVLLAGTAWWSIHTAWFAVLIRGRLVAALGKATGGRVELGHFAFDPDTLQASISNLVIHGTEGPSDLPLLTLKSAGLHIKLLSVWRQQVDLESLTVHQPKIHLIIRADGSTNLPRPRNSLPMDPMEQLLDLKIRYLEVTQGLVAVNDQQLPFQFLARGTSLSLTYRYISASYGFSLGSNTINGAFRNARWKPLKLSVTGDLYKDHADIQSLHAATLDNSSLIDASARVDHFSHLSADAKLKASLAIDDLAELSGIHKQLRNGRAALTGTLYFNRDANEFSFSGKALAHDVDYVSPVFTLRGISGTSNLIADNHGIVLHRIEAAARGAHFSGEGTIGNYRKLDVRGRVSQVSLTEVGSYLTNRPFPWSGSAYGTAAATATLTNLDPNFSITAKVDVRPSSSGIPASGNVDITYQASRQLVLFGNSTLHLPNSTISFQGQLDTDLALNVDSTNTADLDPILPILGANLQTSDTPVLGAGGKAHFSGILHDSFRHPALNGELAASHFAFRGYDWDALTGSVHFSSDNLAVSNLRLKQSNAILTGSASAQLNGWSLTANTPLRLDGRFNNLDLVRTATIFLKTGVPLIQGVASGNISLQGSWNNPRGSTSVRVRNLDAYGQQLNQVQFDATLDGARIQVKQGRVQAGPAVLNFSGAYQHSPANWSTGDIALKADTNGFPLASLSSVRKYAPALDSRAEIHLDANGKLRSTSFEPFKLDGSAQFQHISVNKRELGNISFFAATAGKGIDFQYSGDLRKTKFHGTAKAQLIAGTPVRGTLQMDRISLATLKSLSSDANLALPLDGYLDGGLTFDGLLEEPAQLHAWATLKDLQVNSISRSAQVATPSTPDIVLHNNTPVVLEVSGGVLHVSKFQMDGQDTSINITGYVPLAGAQPVALKAVGKADLSLFGLFDPNVRSSGGSELDAEITGSLTAPSVNGTVRVRNGSFFLANVSNGLSDVNGTVLFSRNRATIQAMSAHSGGGDISLGGSLSFGQGSPLVYHLEAAARNVRVRYANSISVTANSDLRLSGTSLSSILSGTLTITRVVFTPNADAGNLLAAASLSTASPADQSDFISGLHLDVSIESAPNLQVSTNLSRDVEAEIQLRLRGTPDHPIVLGNITANQGDIKIFGTRFSLNRGEVSFVNTIRIEPVLDLDLETQARGITVDITVSGTPNKLNFNYRSDPPLQPRDIIALLTVGQAPQVGTVSNAQTGSDVSALKSGVNSVLDQAISPVSGRLSKLFGIANIKIDPFVQGITNTPQARLSIEQQISRNVTVTYVTNLSQTSEQIFRFEWALNRQFSIVALRDDNGEFGIDFQYKKRFK
jgi:translocation and assembly module TamB